MRGENESEVAGRTGRGEVADFGFASAAEVASLREIAVAGAECGLGFYDSGGETHHKECGLVEFLRFGVCRTYHRGCCDPHE